MKENQREELLKHLAASLHDAKKEGGAILLVGAGISVSAGIPPAFKLMKIAIENFPNYFTEEEQRLAQEDLSQLQYNDIMTKLSNVKRKELFKWFIEGNKDKGIKKAKLNFAHIAIAELLKQGYFSRILTVNFDPLLIHACYMVGMYPFPAIYDLGAMGKVNAELLHDPSIVYLNGQHVGFVQRNTTDQLEAHKETLTQIVRSTGCKNLGCGWLRGENVVKGGVVRHLNDQRRLRRSRISSDLGGNYLILFIPNGASVSIKNSLSVLVAHNGATGRGNHVAVVKRFGRMLVEVNSCFVSKIPDV